MKKSVLRRLAALSFGASLAPACLMAQSGMYVKVPFDFTVGRKSLPAGVYYVQPEIAAHILAFRSAPGRSAVLTQTIPVLDRYRTGTATFTFNRYGDRYFLFEIWNPIGGSGWQMHKSVAERELMARKSLSTRVAVAASVR